MIILQFQFQQEVKKLQQEDIFKEDLSKHTNAKRIVPCAANEMQKNRWTAHAHAAMSKFIV